jgi:mRNA-decapping enzyme subunit 1
MAEQTAQVEQSEQTEQDQLLLNRALFAQTLTFNVIGRYDPKLTNLLFTSGNSQIYEYVLATGEWLKLPYKGPLAIYSRDGSEDGYDSGLMVLNKEKLENFSIGVMTGEVSEKKGKEVMKVENTESLTVVKDSEGRAFGIWIQDDKERLCELLTALIQGKIPKTE